MARPKKYHTAAERAEANAERQAAFRQRSTVVDRAGLEELRTLLERFQVSARAAARAGDPVAAGVLGATAEGTMKRLCERWENVAVPKPPGKPDGPETGE